MRLDDDNYVTAELATISERYVKKEKVIPAESVIISKGPIDLKEIISNYGSYTVLNCMSGASTKASLDQIRDIGTKSIDCVGGHDYNRSLEEKALDKLKESANEISKFIGMPYFNLSNIRHKVVMERRVKFDMSGCGNLACFFNKHLVYWIDIDADITLYKMK